MDKPEKTGKSLEVWYQFIVSANVDSHSDIVKLLIGENSVTHGYTNTMSSLYCEQRITWSTYNMQVQNLT